jgi:cytochrome c oxidase subunit IV
MAQALHTPAGHGDNVEHASHPKASFYVVIFFILLIVTIAEVFVAQDPLKGIFNSMGLPLLVPLGVLALAKFLMIAAFYMHLRFDSRIFSAFFVVGMVLATSMIITIMGIFTAHYREPFDEVAWRKEMLQQQGGGTGGTTTTGGATHYPLP